MSLDLDADQLERYARHITLDEVGPGGQSALFEASVLVVGAGGLGSPVIQYLAAAGVGRLGIADDDTVELSNLQRQVLHGEADVGRPKVDSAAAFVAALNPDVSVQPHHCRITADCAVDMISPYDVVVDCSDSFQTRFLLNDACVLSGTPLSHGAVDRFEGQVTTFTGGRPCYRCLFPAAPPAGTVEDCATRGVLGVVPGVIGTMQALATLSLLLDYGDALAGRLLVFDGTSMTTETVQLHPSPECPVCGPDASVDDLDTEHYTGRCDIEM